MPSKEQRKRQQKKEYNAKRRSKDSAELSKPINSANVPSTSGLDVTSQFQFGTSTQSITTTSAEEALTFSESTPKGMRRTHSKIIQDKQNIHVPQSPSTPASKRPCDAVFEFPSIQNGEHESDDDANLELPVAADCIAVNVPKKRGHPSRTPSHNPRGRKSDTDRPNDKHTPLLATANTSNLRLLPKLKSRHVELIEQRMRDIKIAYTNRKWLPKKDNNRNKKQSCLTGCSCAKCYIDAEAYIKSSDYIAQHREDDDHFVQGKMGKLASVPTSRCHLSPAETANKNLGCAATSSNHQLICHLPSGVWSAKAKELGLLESDDLYRKAMHDANVEKSNLKQLIHYFAMLIFHCNPSDPQKLFDDFLDDMYPPPASNDENAEPISNERRRQKVMCTLEYFFRCLGTTSSEMGLSGLPPTYNHERVSSEIEGEGLLDDFYGSANRKTNFREVALQHLKNLNEEQRTAFDAITSAITSEEPTIKRLFFLEGAGGCGKTYLYNTLIRWCLAGKPTDHHAESAKTLNRNSVVACATTGIAALLLIGGGTVHRQFRITNDVDKNTPPRINAESMDAERLRNAELIIIDEVSMMHRDVFNYLDRLLRDICSSSIPFGGKTMLFGGDWKQLTPVVPRGNRQDQVEASIKTDPLFSSEFTTLRLKKNMRAAPDQKKLCQWLLQVGNDSAEAATNGLLRVPDECICHSIDDILEFCFPAEVLQAPMKNADIICDRALLCPRNTDVECLNTLAMKKLQGSEMQYFSTDSPLDSSDPLDYLSIYRADFNLESIHNETPTGLPPHELILKTGAPIMLIKNLDVSQGLCNGTRLQVEKMTPHNLYCRILTGPKADAKSTVILPRILFEYGKQSNERGVRFQRLQFPVRPCFAMTVNKAQGQTLKRMGLVLSSNQCFSHGQVYVAMSRVTEFSGIRVYSPNSAVPNHINNIVYHELLDGRKVIPAKSAPLPSLYDPLPDEFIFDT